MRLPNKRGGVESIMLRARVGKKIVLASGNVGVARL